MWILLYPFSFLLFFLLLFLILPIKYITSLIISFSFSFLFFSFLFLSFPFCPFHSLIEAGANSMEPAALNWFNASYDETVPVFYRKALGRLGFLTPLMLWIAKSPKPKN